MRLETIRLAGERNVPFTSGILIGIGETRQERIESLLALRDLNDVHGHIQEIIIQNFRPKPGTRMENAAAPDVDDHLWTIAVARLIFEPSMNIQAPPNLSPGALGRLVAAGINDWGGVSPVTPDHVNPEAPWPHLAGSGGGDQGGRHGSCGTPGDLPGLCARYQTGGLIKACRRRFSIASTATACRVSMSGVRVMSGNCRRGNLNGSQGPAR